MNVCVMGLWHLGSVTAACMASIGHRVVGFDYDEAAIAGLQKARPPLFEPGLEELLRKGIVSGSLSFSSDLKAATTDAELLWVCYDTPVDQEDHADVDFVIARIVRVLPFLQKGTTVLLSSQLPVGSTRRLEALAATKYSDLDLGFACSPENLRLGKAIEVFSNPDRVVVGARLERDKSRLAKLFSMTERIEWVSVESAEMTKHAINAFLATSIAFANEIASICELVGADAKEVERGLKSDSRIGPRAYLSPGGAFAGGTLARDIGFLDMIGKERGLNTYLLSSVTASNDEHKHWARRLLRRELGSLQGARVALWGLTYKPDTDTLRRSMAMELCAWLMDQGVEVRVHDPAVQALPQPFAGSVRRFQDPLQALEGAQALVVCTEWPLYKEIRAEDLIKVAPGLLVLDANRFLARVASARGIGYVAVGSPLTGDRRK